MSASILSSCIGEPLAHPFQWFCGFQETFHCRLWPSWVCYRQQTALILGVKSHILLKMYFCRLDAMAQKQTINLVSVQALAVVQSLLPRIFPANWNHLREVAWSPGIDNQPTQAWLQEFWNYLRQVAFMFACKFPLECHQAHHHSTGEAFLFHAQYILVVSIILC